MLISVLWREELKYRSSIIGIEQKLDFKNPQKDTLEPNYTGDILKPDTSSKGYLGKRKPGGEGWSKKYGKYLLEMFI